MLITALLPDDRARAIIGNKLDKQPNGPNPRVQLLVAGAFFLFIGLVMLGVIRP